MSRPDRCPHCNASLFGEEIPEDIRAHYSPPYRWRVRSRNIVLIEIEPSPTSVPTAKSNGRHSPHERPQMSEQPMRACKPTEPVMVAWKVYQDTEDFANSKKWAIHSEHVQGSLWAAFSEGFRLATERAAMLHESVNPASDDGGR